MNQFISCVVFACVLLSTILKCSAAQMSLGQWMEWSSWSTCTERVYCSEGTQERHRDCERGRRCVGIEAESQGCPDSSCTARPLVVDVAHAEMHSFIATECATSVKYYAGGRYARLMKHNVSRMFSRGREVLDNSYYNIKVTKKTLNFESDIFKYCFEPEVKSITLDEFKIMFVSGSLRFKYASLHCPIPELTEPKYVTGFAIGLEESGQPYGIYIQVKAENGFTSIYYKHMSGSYTNAYNLIWS